MINTIPTSKDLEPYALIAEQTAKLSPCARRRFGAVIVYNGPDIDHVAAFNERLSNCCRGSSCVREHLSLYSMERVEVGAEIHAETAALILGGRKRPGDYFILVGLTSTGKHLTAPAVYPCHTCALNIKFAGYKNVFVKNTDGVLSPVSIARIIEYREQEYNRSSN